MVWFNDWWQSLSLLGQIMACAAIPATLVMLIQLALMVVGAGFGLDADSDGDSDTDFDVDDCDGHDFEHEVHDHDHHHGGGIKLLTIRGGVAFFAIGGWAGLAALTAGIPALWSVKIALLAGAAAMFAAAYAISLALKMQSSGNLDLSNALGCTATVYITIPPTRINTGKVTMLLQDRFVELEAVTDCGTAIKPGVEVEVVGVRDADCLIVSQITRGGPSTIEQADRIVQE